MPVAASVPGSVVRPPAPRRSARPAGGGREKAPASRSTKHHDEIGEGLCRVEAGKTVAHGERQAVFAAVGRPGDGEIVDHLREGERDHDEIDARRAQADEADRQRHEAAKEDRNKPDDGHGGRARQTEGDGLHVEGMGGQHACNVAAKAEEGGMAEGDKAAEPEGDVEPDCGQRQDRYAGGERDIEGFAQEQRCQRAAGSRRARRMLIVVSREIIASGPRSRETGRSAGRRGSAP
jgi:hypothetical protein